MLTTTTIAYVRHNECGAVEHGIAEVPHDAARTRPSWRECSLAIPGFFRGEVVGAPSPATGYKLIGRDHNNKRVEHAAPDMATLDEVARFALAAGWTNLIALDSTGRDVTFEVPAFCE